jgi:hypothetical protein
MRIRKGDLTAVVDDNGAFLREIEIGEEELFRGIGFVARDSDWGTPALDGIAAASEAAGGTQVKSAGELETAAGDLSSSITWTIGEDRIEASAQWSSRSGFSTNRTGFVALHSLGATRGQSVRVTHPDGAVETTRFPRLVSPHQPFFDIAAMDYETVGGRRLRLTFSGEIFEIEDQRNWTDASYKTYCRPLRLPFPYRIEPGERARQTVRLEILSRGGPRRPAGRVAPTVGEAHRLALIGTSIPPGPLERDAARALERLGLNFKAIELDLLDPSSLDDFGDKLALSPRATRVDIRPAPRDAVLAAIGALAPKLTRDHCLGVTLWGADDNLIAEARRMSGGLAIGAGSPGSFVDLNRARPLPLSADYLCWSSNPTVHGVTDDTIGETTETSDDILATIQAKSPNHLLYLGPLTLGQRFNPVAATPEGRTGAPPDPRQGETIAAAWAFATLAGFHGAELRAIAIFEPCGAKGFISPTGEFTAAAHVVGRLAAVSGAPARALRWAHAPRARGLLIEAPGARRLCIAYAAARRETLPLPPGDWRLERLSRRGFEQAVAVANEIEVEDFAIAWLTTPASSLVN